MSHDPHPMRLENSKKIVALDRMYPKKKITKSENNVNGKYL